MKRIHALIILISLIVTIIILIGYFLGNVQHRLDDQVPEDVMSVLSPDNIPYSENQTLFALQLHATSNFGKVTRLKNKLRNYGQKTKITKLKREGQIVYRLRAEDLLPEDEAIALGEQLKSIFSGIDGYWLEEQAVYQTSTFSNVKVEPEVSEVVPTKVVPTKAVPSKLVPSKVVPTKVVPKSQVSGVKEYEIQLMASSNYKSINSQKKYLDKLGYPAKLLEANIKGKTIYRLRLKKRYSKKEALSVGKKIVDSTTFNDFWLQDLQGNDLYPKDKPKEKLKDTSKEKASFKGNYEIQIMANTKRSHVEKKKSELEKYGYQGKIVTATVKGKKYYRLRLANSYNQSKAEEVSKQLTKDVPFIKECWLVKVNLIAPAQKTVKKAKTKKTTPDILDTPKKSDTLVTSLNPRYAPRQVLYTLTCPNNNVDIRIGPGTYYDRDNIGKLMKGVKIYVVEERKGWLRFRLKKDEYNWAGWVREGEVK